MSSIDPHDLVCAWLDIPFGYRAPPPAPSRCPQSRTSSGSRRLSSCPLDSSAPSVIPSPPPKRCYTMVGENEHESEAPTPPGKRLHFTPVLSSSGVVFRPDSGLSRYADLDTMMSVREGPSQVSTTVAPSELLAKRQFLERFVPSCTFGPPPLEEDPPSATSNEDGNFGNYTADRFPLSVPVALPPHVLPVVRTLSPANFEVGCIPLVPGTTDFLETFVPYEDFPAHSFLAVASADYHPRALALLHFAAGVHRTCTHNCANALDEAAWYPCVQSLLSVTPGHIPFPPPSLLTPPSPDTLFLTIDSTTKLTSSSILPEHPDVKLDALLVFNHAHKDVAPLIEHNRRVNALADACSHRAIVALGVEVKSTIGGGALLAAEYQLAVFGLKTLEVARQLAEVAGDEIQRACDVALSLSVCGHVWTLYVTYWSAPGRMATHGPVMVGATDTLLGTMKVVGFVVALKRWAREKPLVDWKGRIEAAVGRGGAGGEREGGEGAGGDVI